MVKINIFTVKIETITLSFVAGFFHHSKLTNLSLCTEMKPTDEIHLSSLTHFNSFKEFRTDIKKSSISHNIHITQ